jgi:pyrimidine operon attenuation protein/uracil phosphoribosyltransferase
MKKYVIIGLVFAALVFASCKLEKGGTIEVINDHSTNASIAVYQGLIKLTEDKTATPGGNVTFDIEEDGTYIVNAVFYSGSTLDHGSGKAVLSGGNKVTVHIEPN